MVPNCTACPHVPWGVASGRCGYRWTCRGVCSCWA